MSGRGDGRSPLYARVLRLKHIHPGGLMCFLLFEGVVGLAILLSLAELVNWLSVLVLPAIVAGLVKVNDIVAAAFARVSVVDATMRFTTRRHLGEARGTASVPRRRREPEIETPTQLLPPQPALPAALPPDQRSPDSAVEAIPVAEAPTRAARRRATNQRPFAPTAAETHKKDR
jgi:hypothetical protein